MAEQKWRFEAIASWQYMAKLQQNCQTIWPDAQQIVYSVEIAAKLRSMCKIHNYPGIYCVNSALFHRVEAVALSL